LKSLYYDARSGKHQIMTFFYTFYMTDHDPTASNEVVV